MASSKLPQEVRQLYSDLDELRQRHPVHPVRKEELEGALVDDSKITKKNKRVRKYYEKQNSYVKELLDVRRDVLSKENYVPIKNTHTLWYRYIRGRNFRDVNDVRIQIWTRRTRDFWSITTTPLRKQSLVLQSAL